MKASAAELPASGHGASTARPGVGGRGRANLQHAIMRELQCRYPTHRAPDGAFSALARELGCSRNRVSQLAAVVGVRIVAPTTCRRGHDKQEHWTGVQCRRCQLIAVRAWRAKQRASNPAASPAPSTPSSQNSAHAPALATHSGIETAATFASHEEN